MLKRSFLLILPVFLFFGSFAQDTIKMMQYNLLYYGQYTSFCTESNNDMDTKADHIADIIDHTLPDIFTVNEIGNSYHTVMHLIGNALNFNGRNYYDKAAILNNDQSSIINMLYYDSRKLDLDAQLSVSTGLRDINIYRMKSLNTDEPVQFHIAVVHLKAGNGEEDAQIRGEMILDFKDFLSGYSDKTNWIFAGDMNFYHSGEAGFQYLTNTDHGNVIFVDPVNQIGNWHDISSFSHYHTQSTHSDDHGCPSSGGLDDRFDFIFVSEDIMTGDNNVQYVEGSYETLGQDGNHFDDAVNDGFNSSAPAHIIDALYGASDHLPVLAEFVVGTGNAIEAENSSNGFDVTINQNDASFINMRIKQLDPSSGDITIYNMLGQKLHTHGFNGVKDQNIKLAFSKQGMFIIVITTDNDVYKKLRIIR
ncbi:MAG: endonuclease/exonuclease/phosphatase family protein [Bacteroidota bacterium]